MCVSVYVHAHWNIVFACNWMFYGDRERENSMGEDRKRQKQADKSRDGEAYVYKPVSVIQS